MKVSVVTVCRDALPALKETLASVQAQTFDDFEYIVKDGGSGDGTPDWLARTAAAWPRLRFVSDADGGIYEAMDRAAALCRGEWVIFLNAGDRFAEAQTLQKVFAVPSDAAVLYGDAIVEDEDGTQSVWEGDLGRIRQRMPACHQTMFFRRDRLPDPPFDMRYRIAADYDLVLRLYEQGERFCHCGQRVAFFRLDGVSSTRYVARVREHARVLMAHGLRGPGYIRSPAYALRLLEGAVKQQLDAHLRGTRLHRALRGWYKKHIKNYKKVT